MKPEQGLLNDLFHPAPALNQEDPLLKAALGEMGRMRRRRRLARAVLGSVPLLLLLLGWWLVKTSPKFGPGIERCPQVSTTHSSNLWQLHTQTGSTPLSELKPALQLVSTQDSPASYQSVSGDELLNLLHIRGAALVGIAPGKQILVLPPGEPERTQ